MSWHPLTIPRLTEPRRCAAAKGFGRFIGVALALGATGLAAAPDEAGYGAAAGYPPGDRSNWFRQPHLVGALSAMEQLFPTHRVAAGADVRPLPPHPAAAHWTFAPQIGAYLAAHPASGLLVLKQGRVLAEHYQYGRQAEQRFTSFSMAKTVVAMAVGIALAEGRIASLDEPVDLIEPALAGTAWQGVTLRHVLQMRSGVRFDETYDQPGSDIARFSRAWTQQRGSLLANLQGFTESEAEPGQRFKYVSAETQVLAQVLVKATGRPLADYVGEKLWGPMGAEADAAWVVDATGQEAGHCCLSARLRDWGRLGLLLMEGGQRDGRPLIPADWLHDATHVRAEDAALMPGRATPYFGYGYQTWIFPANFGFALLGVRGQAVYVHPASGLVMVQTGVWPRSSDAALARERDRFWRALVQAAKSL